MNAKKHPPLTKLLWIDMEMSGLDVEKEVIIEVAAIITDMKLNSLDTYHAVLKQPAKYLENMDEWNRKHHGDSGLLQLIPNGRNPDSVEKDLLDLANQHYKLDERPVLAGNSIGQDRLFINRHMPKLAARLHYRMLDVTSWKIIFNECYDKKYEKQNAHRAVDDIRESINEMKFYLQFLNI